MSDRLDRIEALLEENSRQLAETRLLVDSNAKAIQAWEQRANTIEEEAEERATTINARLVDRIERDEDHYDEQIRRFDRLHTEHNQRFETLLQEARADRQRFDESMAANAAEHRAFTQNIQVLLAEIARLWQRVAG
jgi:hypothetical protein